MVRAALRHRLMAPFAPYLKSFVTVASPHLGLLYTQSALFSTGVCPGCGVSVGAFVV